MSSLTSDEEDEEESPLPEVTCAGWAADGASECTASGGNQPLPFVITFFAALEEEEEDVCGRLEKHDMSSGRG